MKKLLVLAALTMAAAPAMASKARLSALGNSEQLKDAQTIFTRPSDLVGLGNWATVELGATPSTAASTYYTNVNSGTAQAEGGFARAMGDGYLGFYLGHHNTMETMTRELASASFTPATNELTEENPVDVYYAAKMGDIAWGAGIWYSNSDKKQTSLKQSSMGVRGSVEMANITAYASLGLQETAEDGTSKYKGGTPLNLGVEYAMGDMFFFGNTQIVQAKVDTAGGTGKINTSAYKVGFVNSMKSEGSDFFYGVAYQGYNQGKDVTAVSYTMLPFWFGIEQEANSWLTLRGSVTQNVILGSYKGTFPATAGSDYNTIDNNTTAAAGVGLKFNKLVLDATIAKTVSGSANAGDINGNNLMSNAALTYMF